MDYIRAFVSGGSNCGSCASFWRVGYRGYIQWLRYICVRVRARARAYVYRGRWCLSGPGFEIHTTVVIKTYGASSPRFHSRIRISGTSFQALSTFELEAQTAPLDPAQTKVMVSREVG
jgi:hypothetical protein